MSMSKKDFIALADVFIKTDPKRLPESLRELSPLVSQGFEGQWETDRDACADFCASQNPRFNRSRWLAYIAGECGPNGGAITRERRALRAFQGGVR